MPKSNVIACLDSSEVSATVNRYAVWSALQLQAPLILLHVLDRASYPVKANLSGNIGLGARESLMEELAELDQQRGKLALEQGRRLLEEMRQQAVALGVTEPIIHQRHGDLLDSLLAIEEDTRLLVLGKHDEKLGTHIGSRIETLLRTLQRPMLVCPAEFKPPQRVMIAFDGSATTHKAVDMVAGSPLFRGMACHVVLVGSDDRSNRGQLQWARDTLETAEFSVTTRLLSGEVETKLCDYRAEADIDILVMGAYGHSVIRRLLVGSTTTAVIRNAHIPVLLLR
ncbi:universal stress protein [Ectothiorhodospiraceae bacterium BW-2]|nr:universal stress protein [Ectothiorhodospiraceae bacterium BW-2]